MSGWDGPPPPFRIETERLVIRCHDAADAPLVKEAIDASLDHLQPFMPWARGEPQPLEEKVALLRRFRDDFEAGLDFGYGIWDRDERELLGGTGLHPRVGAGGLEIGYWVRAGRTREGIATESAAALTRVAIEVCTADRVEIRIDPVNRPSLGVPRKLGFTEEATLRRRLPGGPGEPFRDATIFTLFREELAGSPAAAVELAAFDAGGRQIV